ncbi:colicin E1 family microcin immunity protein [Yersinia ruckeri]|uniref:colicin E1 family microcin immunity protein n=1 Tax=Yersinia ruckeri TaxID=29486 RepID=UPI0011A9B2A6|nr:colicin E1 family microcin immunity protein [Yersinia ruckeri]MCK8585274.1 colicin E1 immunity protein [Yersinia ruckeri]
MTIKYYFKNIIAGLFIVIVFYYQWHKNQESEKETILLTLSIISCFLYPLSKKLVEDVALSFTKKEFWQHDFFVHPMGGSMQAILYVFCFVFAIPFGVIFMILSILKALTNKI